MKEIEITVKVFDSVEKTKNILARQGLCKTRSVSKSFLDSVLLKSLFQAPFGSRFIVSFKSSIICSYISG